MKIKTIAFYTLSISTSIISSCNFSTTENLGKENKQKSESLNNKTKKIIKSQKNQPIERVFLNKVNFETLPDDIYNFYDNEIIVSHDNIRIALNIIKDQAIDLYITSEKNTNFDISIIEELNTYNPRKIDRKSKEEEEHLNEMKVDNHSESEDESEDKSEDESEDENEREDEKLETSEINIKNLANFEWIEKFQQVSHITFVKLENPIRYLEQIVKYCPNINSLRFENSEIQTSDIEFIMNMHFPKMEELIIYSTSFREKLFKGCSLLLTKYEKYESNMSIEVFSFNEETLEKIGFYSYESLFSLNSNPKTGEANIIIENNCMSQIKNISLDVYKKNKESMDYEDSMECEASVKSNDPKRSEEFWENDYSSEYGESK